MAEKKRKKRKHFSKLMQKKLVGSFALVLFVLLGLNLRIVYITAKNGDNYAIQVLSQKQYDSRTIPYKRGEIQDRNGNVFAKSEKVYNVILDCVAVNGGDEEEQAKLKEQEIDYIEPTIDALVKTLGLDEAELRSLITDPATSGSRYQVLKKGISLEEKQTFEDYTEIDSEKEYTKTDLARRQCVQGVWFEEDYVRDYPLKTLASNVIGVGSNSGGASGLESYYTDVLSGTDGREFGYLDENSDLQRTIVEPTNGNTIVSTLDINSGFPEYDFFTTLWACEYVRPNHILNFSDTPICMFCLKHPSAFLFDFRENTVGLLFKLRNIYRRVVAAAYESRHRRKIVQ